MKQILVIVINKNSSKVALINNYGDIQLKFFVDHDFKKGLLKNLREQIVLGLETIGIDFKSTVEKIGIATTGFIDHDMGVVRKNTDIGWEDYYLKDMAEQEFKKQCHLLNIYNAKALGEFWVGNAKTIYSMMFISIGDELGGAVILDGKLLTGNRGFAGSFGHGGGYQTRYLCDCGLQGCLNATISYSGIERRFIDEIRTKGSEIAEYFFEIKNIKNLKVADILNIYIENGRPKQFKAIFDDIALAMTKKIGALVQNLDPEAVMIACENKELLNVLFDSIKRKLPKFINSIYLEELSLLEDKLGEDSDLIGCANFAINDWKLY